MEKSEFQSEKSHRGTYSKMQSLVYTNISSKYFSSCSVRSVKSNNKIKPDWGGVHLMIFINHRTLYFYRAEEKRDLLMFFRSLRFFVEWCDYRKRTFKHFKVESKVFQFKHIWKVKLMSIWGFKITFLKFSNDRKYFYWLLGFAFVCNK